ncbi:hypothetical protein KKF04_01795, partial [Patescibacteria group bacterium]|nr:hypothetical protein [Patescibacteria group bacterium]
SYYFDSIEPTLQTHIVLPFVIADEGVATSPLIYDQTYIGVTTPSLVDYSYDDPLLNQYPVQVAAFAPTSCGASCDNQTFTMETIQFTVDDAEYITINISGIDEVVQLASYPYELDDTAEIGGGNPIGSESAYLFTPALTVSTGTVDQEPLIVGVPVEATFALINESSSDTINGIAVDNHLTFEDTGAQAVLDFRNIDSGNVTPDPYFGRTDPWEFGIGSPRYLIYGDQFAFAPDNSLFYSASKNYHPVDYYFEGNQNTSGVLDANGVYEVDGFWDLPVPIDYDEDLPEDWPATAVTPYTYIDRADPLAFSALTSGLSENITLNFIPMQWIGEGLTGDVTFNLDNYLAYRMEDAPFGNDTIYAIYEPARTIDGIGVKSIGVEATGVVTGEQVYETIGGRDLEAISTTGTAELRKQIRTNVASLSRNLSPCGANGTLSNLSLVSGGCIKVDDANDTVVTVYEGGVGDLLTIDLGASNPVPDYGYTVIVTGGADVLISDNIVYNSSASSFGIIALADENGEGGNVFIGPDSTNIVGLLYAEGSMISSPDGIHVYYGTNALDANELKNQLYWQGSIVSKNTIGGAPNRVFPENVYCFASDNASCAQIYDMDYIRRFTVNTYQPLGGGYSADNILFSGGGSCIAGDPPVCSLGTLPTTIVLDGNSLIDMTASDIDPFYVEKSTRTAPPGFTVTGGFEQAVEIR